MKICANFAILPSISLKENAGSDRSWVWQCADFSEEKSDLSVLAIRFATSESALRHAAPSNPSPFPPRFHPHHRPRAHLGLCHVRRPSCAEYPLRAPPQTR